MIVSKRGSIIKIGDKRAEEYFDKIPAGTYQLGMDERTAEFYLTEVDAMETPEKIYGDAEKTVDRVYNTFSKREGSTGVLLSGEKGSGKTLTTKLVCNKAIEDGIPVILINAPFPGTLMSTFLNSIDHPVVLLIDEFEKVYKDKAGMQDSLLTLLDGTMSARRLFLLTSNDKYGISSYMKNRPGRIYYAIEFDVLDEAFITEFANDTLNDVNHVDSLVQACRILGGVNFDLLQAIIEEVNRYNEAPVEALKWINAEPRSFYDRGWKLYEAKVTDPKGNKVEGEHRSLTFKASEHPLSGLEKYLQFQYRDPTIEKVMEIDEETGEEYEVDNDEWVDFHIGSNNLVNYDDEQYIYETEDGWTISLSEKKAQKAIGYTEVLEKSGQKKAVKVT